MQVMLSKHANVCFDVTDNMTMLELNTSAEIISEYFEEMKKRADDMQKNNDMAQSTGERRQTIDVSDNDLMSMLP